MTAEERIALLCKRIGDDAASDFQIILRQSIQAAYEDAANLVETGDVITDTAGPRAKLCATEALVRAAYAIRARAKEVSHADG